MKYTFLAFLFLLPIYVNGQSCQLLTQTFAIADTMNSNSRVLYVFRFSMKQLDDLHQLPDLEKAIPAIKKIQKTLDEDNASYKNGVLWQLDEKLAEKHLAELRKVCPQTGFKVFEREIEFYKLKYTVKEKGKER